MASKSTRRQKEPKKGKLKLWYDFKDIPYSSPDLAEIMYEYITQEHILPYYQADYTREPISIYDWIYTQAWVDFSVWAFDLYRLNIIDDYKESKEREQEYGL